MVKEEILFTVQNHLEDKDYEDVYRIHQETERKDRKIALIICLCLAVICIVLLVILKNISFLFYTIACVIVGIAYIKIPSNRKFLATTRLLMGDHQTVTFMPHSIYVEELYESDEAFGEAVDADVEENEDAGVTMKTFGLMVYENERAFLFADGKITNLFVYIPKRCLDEAQIALLKEYAKERCSKGYVIMEMSSHIVETEEGEDDDLLEAMSETHVDEREQYYGAKRLRLRDENGKRVSVMDDDEDEIPDKALVEETSEEDCDCNDDCDCDDLEEFE